MSSLRERQKQARHNQILESARNHFVTHGYSKANMDAIADHANVGVATIYSYFETKEGLVAGLTRKDATELINEVEEIWSQLPDDSILAICTILSVYTKYFDCVSYGIIRELMSKSKQSGPVRMTTRWIREHQIDQLKRTLDQRQIAGRVDPALDTYTATCIIIDILDRHMNRMSNYPEQGANEDTLNNAINVLFGNWLT